MIELYEPYCVADSVFFEAPQQLDDRGSYFAVSRREVPPGWTRTERQTWVVLRPDDVPGPTQGWKVHVSARLDSADRVLDTVWDHAVRHRMAFKFLRSRTALHMANYKYAGRGSSGKLAALYPVDDSDLNAILVELGAALSGQEGPYILGDLRSGSGPLYVRYGSFVERYCPGPDGELVLAMEGPDGRLVPDVRRPVFSVPAWAKMPDFLAAEFAATQAETKAAKLPYDVERALHFSNGGGIYLARDPATDRQVVLKEARPLAGLDRHEVDAVARLQHEWQVMQRLAGLDVVPQPLRYFTCWEHHFLAQEFIAGDSLHRERARRHPLNYPDSAEEQVAEYTGWALDVLRLVEDALEAIHGRGITYGDLHPANVLLRPDGRVVLVDFELSGGVGDPRPAGLGAPGFTSRTVAPGVPTDRYALGCLRLSMFLPLTALIQTDPDKVATLVDAVTQRFPVPAGFAQQVRSELLPGLPPVLPVAAARVLARSTPVDRCSSWSPPDHERLCVALADGILATATPERTDRLFPGDPQQFRFGGHTLAYGAAGVLLALAAVGTRHLDRYVDWLVAAARRPARPRTGLFDGLHGTAYALDRLGRCDEAFAVLQRATEIQQPTGPTLFDGQAGIGLSLLHFLQATDAATLRDHVVRSADRVLAAIDVPHDDLTSRPGLTHGWAGVALFLIRMYEYCGDPALLDGAVAALERDLARCRTMAGGAVHLFDGARVMPFLADGSAGVGLALAAIRAHRDGEHYAALATGIERACCAELVFEPGLFHGLAGMLAYRALVGTAGVTPPPLGADPGHRGPAVLLAAQRLAWYAVPYRGHVVVPGRMLLRLSTDLATGSAGVLLALHAISAGEPAVVPIPGLQPVPRTPECSEGGEPDDNS